jgi:hypothetical protein
MRARQCICQARRRHSRTRRVLGQFAPFKVLHQAGHLWRGCEHEVVLHDIDVAILPRPRINGTQPLPVHRPNVG